MRKRTIRPKAMAGGTLSRTSWSWKDKLAKLTSPLWLVFVNSRHCWGTLCSRKRCSLEDLVMTSAGTGRMDDVAGWNSPWTYPGFCHLPWWLPGWPGTSLGQMVVSVFCVWHVGMHPGSTDQHAAEDSWIIKMKGDDVAWHGNRATSSPCSFSTSLHF